MLETTIEKFREVVQVFKSEESEVRKKLEAALKRREDLHTLPLPREDFIEQVCELVDAAGNNFPEYLKNPLDFLRSQPLKTFNAATINPLVLHGKLSPEALIWCLREPIKKGIAEAIRTWDWPEEVGPTRAERLKELKSLDKEIEKLQDKLANIKGIADREGVALTGIGIGEQRDRRLLKKPKSTTPE